MKTEITKIIVGLLVLVALTVFIQGVQADAIDAEVADLNLVLQAENLSWVADRTSVMELSPEERRALCGGPMEPVIVTETSLYDEAQTAGYEPIALQASATWDWRNVSGINWMSPVSSQGNCGDCWAHATCGSMEVRMKFQKGGTYGYELPIDLAQRYASSCARPGNECNAWNIPSMLDWVQANGVTDEACLPYSHAVFCGDACSNANVREWTIASHGSYSSSLVSNIQTSCENYGPIIVWMMVYSDFFGYSSGIYTVSPGATAEGGHFVNVVGWNSSGGTDYWICKNSWGTGWGINGYFLIERGVNESRMEEAAYWLTPQNLPNLTEVTPTGWDYPIVPRGDTTATESSCILPATLPGNADNYLNFAWTNDGSVQSPPNTTHVTLDGAYIRWASIAYQPTDYQVKFINQGAHTIRGGRHTLCMDQIDEDEFVWENDESDNDYCRQYVWSPYGLSFNSPVERGTPPTKDSLGYSFYNCDGFSFDVDGEYVDNEYINYWVACAVLPQSSTADYDIRLHDIGTYTGSTEGFGSNIEWSSFGSGQTDFVIVNDNTAASGTYYGGAFNYNDGSGSFRIEADGSESLSKRPSTQWNGPYSKSSTNVIDMYEVYLAAGKNFIKLDQTSGSCDLAMRLYDASTEFASISDSMAYANATGDGGDEAFEVDIASSGYYGLAVYKPDYTEYSDLMYYQIAVGPTDFEIATPSGGSYYSGNLVYINWDDFGYTTGSTVKIEVTHDNGSNWEVLTDSTPNDGSFYWYAQGPSTQCMVRVTSNEYPTVSDTSNQFTITNIPTPSSPAPASGASDVSPHTYLSWSGAGGSSLFDRDILWDLSHGLFLGYQPSGNYSDLVDILDDKGYDIDTTTSGVQYVSLSSYDILVASIGGAADSAYTTAEVDLIENWVYSGGALLILSDNPSTPVYNLNPLAERFNVTTGVSTTGATCDSMATHPLFSGCGSGLNMPSPGTLAVASPCLENAWISSNAVVASTTFGSGRVVIVGDINFATNTNIDDDANRQFAENIFDWLALRPGIPTHAVYCSTLYPPENLAAPFLTSLSCDPAPSPTWLDGCDRHYWYVVAYSGTGDAVAGPVWYFDTELMGDINGDDIVAMEDYLKLATNWGGVNCSSPLWCGGADLNHDGHVNMADLLIYCSIWLDTCP